MKKIIKIGLKLILGTFGVLVLIAAIFVAFNFTLVKNLPSSQDGGADAMYIANQNPRQLVKGTQSNDLPTKFLPQERFASAQTNWEETGGKALLVWHKGALVYEKYADGVSQEDRSRSFSMHKSVLSLVAAAMESDGLISLDDPVNLYLDVYKKGGRENLTIRNMLHHQTGLERYSFTPPSLDTLNLLLSDRIEKAALKAELVSDPQVFDYSNLGYQVAGAALRSALREKAGKTYRQYLSERIWSQIGANDAYLWSETEDGAPRFYAGMQASPRDWLKVGIMMAENSGSVLSESAIDTVLNPSPGNPDYGLGVWLGSPDDGEREYGPSTAMKVKSAEPFRVQDTVFFDGFGGQRVYISQSEELVVVRIGDVRFDWDDTVLPNLVSEALGLGKTVFYEKRLQLKGSNERVIPVRLVSPSAKCVDCKLVLFSHGAFATDVDYDAIIEPMVKMGYSVVIPTHVDSVENPLKATTEPDQYISLRLEDHAVILAHYAKSDYANKGWVAAGHSFGGMLAAMMGGATLDEANISPMGLPSHVIALSPPGKIPNYFTSDMIERLKVPTLVITGTADIVPGMIDDWEDHLDVYNTAPEAIAQAVIFDDIDHYFNGLYGRPKERDTIAADRDLVALTQAFLSGQPLKASEGYKVLPPK